MQKKDKGEKEGNQLRVWLFWMRVGSRTGCHQRTDRSFSLNGYQFPICARCTGIAIGYLLAIVLLCLYSATYIFCIVMCIPMLIDGGTQFFKMRESTNILRLLTGIMAGYGIATFQLRLLFQLII